MSRSPMRCEDEVVTLISRWTIGSTGAHAKTAGYPGTGFTGIARTAAGKYTVTFNYGVPVGGLIDLDVRHWAAADAANLNPRPTVSSYTTETASAAATVKYETWDNDTTAQTELTSGDQVTVTARFLKTKGV